MRHSHFPFPRRLTTAVGILMAGILLGGCNLPISLPGLLGQDSGSGSAGSNGGAVQDDIPPEPIAACPPRGSTARLTFNHDIIWGLEGIGQFGITVSGEYRLHIIQSGFTHEPGGKVGVHNIDSGDLPVKVRAIGFEGCTDGTGGTTMRADITGTCKEDELVLFIQEYYREASVSITCNEDDEPVEIPLPLGPLEAPVTWKMGIEEIYFRTAKHTVSFAGYAGSGGMNYTLTVIPIE